MKTIQVMCLLFVLYSTQALAALKRDSLGLPGDNFDLYAALELFKKAESPEAFEKAINAPDNEVNNLDLDADGKVDYVKVTDKSKGEAHSLVLQVAVSKTETQDVAVIEVEKTGDGQAHVQIVGDEDLYGKNYIVEPKDETATAASPAPATSTKNKQADDGDEDDVYNTSRSSASSNNNSSNNYNNTNYTDNSSYSSPPVVVNVWAWPSVQFMYGPAYVGWSSPWYWGYYPGWWQPWPPIYWGVYYRRMYRYHYPYYHRTVYYRCNVAHNYYYGQRMASETVRRNSSSGVYRQRQMAARNTPVQGHRYNNMPANPARNTAGRQSAERNAAIQSRQTPAIEKATRNAAASQQPRQAGGSAQPRQQTGQPKQMNSSVGAGKAAPRIESQPRQQASPQPQMRSQPRQEMSRPQSMPHGGGGGGAPRGGGGGGMPRGGGGMGGGGGHGGRR